MKIWCVYDNYTLVAKFYEKIKAEYYCVQFGLRCEGVDIP